VCCRLLVYLLAAVVKCCCRGLIACWPTQVAPWLHFYALFICTGSDPCALCCVLCAVCCVLQAAGLPSGSGREVLLSWLAGVAAANEVRCKGGEYSALQHLMGE
jgi:hypothetical protein